LSERDFAAVVERELGADNTIGVGYNSIRFDDEVTRFLFWRNLVDPYAREWQNGCGRWDLMDVVRTTWALRPAGLQWPTYGEGEMQGRPSFKLEHLTRANGIVHDAAHDALSDVRATIALARLIRRHNPRLWDFCLKLHKKEAVWAEIGLAKGSQQVPRPFVHLSTRYPIERGNLAIAWPLAPHPTNRNEVIVWDLSRDPRELLGLDAETVRRRIYTRQDELPPGETRLPLKTVHVNKSPIVVGDLRILDPVAQRWSLDVAQARQHAQHAAALGRTLDPLWARVYVRPGAAADQPVDVDEDLYGQFLSDGDRRTLNRLRALGAEQLAGARPAFEDERLDELLFRYRARNFAETLNEAERARWQGHCAQRLHGGAGGALTLSAYLERIDSLAEAALAREDERAQALLEALVDYGEGIAPEAG
jgi:exodeoxyribonuclease-1